MYAQSYIKLCVFQTFEYAKVKKMLENLKQARKILSTAHYRLEMRRIKKLFFQRQDRGRGFQSCGR